MKKIIIADDSSTMRNFLKRILVDAGYDIVAEVSDGISTVEKYTKFKPDLVILDVTMPELSGLDALKHIRRIDNKARILMCSSMGQSYHMNNAMEHGAKGFVIKPFNPSDIIETVNKILSEEN